MVDQRYFRTQKDFISLYIYQLTVEIMHLTFSISDPNELPRTNFKGRQT